MEEQLEQLIKFNYTIYTMGLAILTVGLFTGQPMLALSSIVLTVPTKRVIALYKKELDKYNNDIENNKEE